MSEETKPADPRAVVDETREFWREVARETVKNSAATIDETAKQLITITGILEGLYFHAITYADLRGKVTDQLIGAYLAPLILWLVSLIAAGLVLFPRLYSIEINSSEAAKKEHEDVSYRKYIFLIVSLGCLVGGIGFLIVVLGVYLRG